MTSFEKINAIALISSALLLSLFTVVSYGHVYNVFGAAIAFIVAMFFGIAAVITIFKSIKKVKKWQTRKN